MDIIGWCNSTRAKVSAAVTDELITILSSKLEQASHQSKGIRALVLKLSEGGVSLSRTQ